MRLLTTLVAVARPDGMADPPCAPATPRLSAGPPSGPPTVVVAGGAGA